MKKNYKYFIIRKKLKYRGENFYCNGYKSVFVSEVC